MNKLKLIFADTDTTYVKSFGEYLVSSKNSSRFEVKLFSSEENLKAYLEKGEEFDLLVHHETMLLQEEVIHKKGLRLRLHEDKTLSVENEEGVFKYQPLNQLVSEMLTLYYEDHSAEPGALAKNPKTDVISVYSPSGGTGKTTFAVNLSRQLALQDYNVFYLNLELFNTTSLFFHTSEDKPSLQIFYYLKARPDQLRSKVEQLKKYDAHSSVNYFDLLPSPDEMLEITQEEIKHLISSLVETGEYDYIIVDLDSAIQDLTLAGLKASHQIIWLLNNDMQSFFKTETMIENGEDFFEDRNLIKDKAFFVMNRFQGRFPEPFAAYNLPIRGYLPNIQEWAEVPDREKVLYHPEYTKEMLTLIRDFTSNNQAGVASG